MEQNFNHVLLCGQVLTQPQPSHVNHSQSFSRFLLSVPRLSGLEGLGKDRHHQPWPLSAAVVEGAKLAGDGDGCAGGQGTQLQQRLGDDHRQTVLLPGEPGDGQ